MTRFLSFVLVAGALLSCPFPAKARPCVGIELSEAVVAEGATLRLNGLGVRRATALRVKVVLLGLYLERPTNDAHEAIASTQTKRLDLHFLRRVSRTDVENVLRRGIYANAPELYGAVEDDLAAIAFALPEGRDGRVFSFVGLPSGETRVFVDGERTVTLQDPAVMPALLSIFLGPTRGNDGVRPALLGVEPCR